MRLPSLRAGLPWIAGLALAACRAPEPVETLPPEGAQCLSLLGEPLFPTELEAEILADREGALAAARAALEASPDDPDALVWVGRRLGYLGRYREALEVFELGLSRYPADPRFPRHVGHRLISVRAFPEAERLLARSAELAEGRADEIEPAGLPNEAGIDIDWLHHSIWYHLALARFLQGDWSGAERGFRRCLALSRNDDARCSAAHWLYTSLRRAGDDAEAARLADAFTRDMEIVEYHAYHRLMLLYRGDEDPEALLEAAREAGGVELATLANGIAHWHRAEGRPERARAIWEEIVAGEAWSAFGHVAAEAELARRR